jgi:hypothetical protein
MSPDYFPPNPIFSQLVKEFSKAGKRLPWVISIKPSGTVGILEEVSTGMYFARQYAMYQRAGMEVMNPRDAVRIVNPA